MDTERIFTDQEKALIWQEWERLRDHPLLSDCEGLLKILRFVLNATVSNQTSELKEYTIGVLALNRVETFDPRIESIVRTQAAKLRSRLASIYEKDGTPLGVRLSFRKGSYRVVIEFVAAQNVAAIAPSKYSPPPQTIRLGNSRRPIILFPDPQTFHSDSPDQEYAVRAAKFLSQVLADLQAFDRFSILHPEILPDLQNSSLNSRKWHSEFGVQFIFDASLITSEPSPQLCCCLINAALEVVLWDVNIHLDDPTHVGEAHLLAARIADLNSLSPMPPFETETGVRNTLDRAWHLVHLLNPNALERARLLLDPAMQTNPLHRGIAITRCINLCTTSFLTNASSLNMRNKARVSLMCAVSSSPEDDIEIHGLAQIAGAIFDWAWESRDTVKMVCHDLRRSQSLIAPYYAFFIALPLGLHTECEALLLHAAKLNPTNPTIPAFRGWSYLAVKDSANARAAFQEALELDPRCAYATEGLSRLETPKALPSALGLMATDPLPGEIAAPGPIGQSFPAAAHFALSGLPALALHHLSLAIRRHEGRTLSVFFDPAFDQFRNTPEFEQFRSTMLSRVEPSRFPALTQTFA